MNSHALISVFDKKNLVKLCKILNQYKIKIISTGGTSAYIKKNGFKCQKVSDITKFKKILGGRVKTLHPKIHSSILFNRDNSKQAQEFKKLKIPRIDFVIVNLYPFEKVNKNNYSECIEMIDIGGPTMLRAAAKNYSSVTSISNTNDYQNLINNLKKNNGLTSLDFRKKMAAKIFLSMSRYDEKIAKWMENKKKPERLNLKNYKEKKLKYGENPHQISFLYEKNKTNSLIKNKIHGKELSFNNIKDIEAAFDCISDFKEPTCVIIKHNAPCGIASNKNIQMAFLKAKNSDTISSFGGIVALNRVVNDKIAKKICKNFFEIILAPNFSKEAISILKKKEKLCLIKTKNININSKDEIFSVINGYIIQEKNKIIINKSNIKLVSKYKTSKKKIDDLIFALRVCKHVKSNSIVFVKDLSTVSIGGGQASRVASTKIAINKIPKKIKSYVVASDAFFPFTDNIKLLYKNGCSAIIQPSGSINDNKIISYANQKKIPLYFSKYRFFKH